MSKNKKKKAGPKCTDEPTGFWFNEERDIPKVVWNTIPAFGSTPNSIIEVVGENQFIVRFDRLLAPYRKKKLPATP